MKFFEYWNQILVKWSSIKLSWDFFFSGDLFLPWLFAFFETISPPTQCFGVWNFNWSLIRNSKILLLLWKIEIHKSLMRTLLSNNLSRMELLISMFKNQSAGRFQQQNLEQNQIFITDWHREHLVLELKMKILSLGWEHRHCQHSRNFIEKLLYHRNGQIFFKFSKISHYLEILSPFILKKKKFWPFRW